MNRNEIILGQIDRYGVGLEIGPSYNPVAAKKAGFNVQIIDHLDSEQLREKYSDIDNSAIEDVDFIYNGESFLELTNRPQNYDWIIASHVVEHSTDLIHFINDCQTVLKGSGVVCLAVPDFRFCFDYFRPLTSLGSVIDAYLDKRRIHTIGTAVESSLNCVDVDGKITWSKMPRRGFHFRHGYDDAVSLIKELKGDVDYRDFHNWCFTPFSFRLLLHDLYHLGFISMREVAFIPTNGLEFFLTLGLHGSGPMMERFELLQMIDRELSVKAAPFASLSSRWYLMKDRFMRHLRAGRF
jgi:predicted SAM-dependent methyltransferase